MEAQRFFPLKSIIKELEPSKSGGAFPCCSVGLGEACSHRRPDTGCDGSGVFETHLKVSQQLKQSCVLLSEEWGGRAKLNCVGMGTGGGR